MRFPEFLKEGGSIGFPAPSFGCVIEPYRSRFDNGQKKLSKMGYRMIPGPNAYLENGIGISNEPKLCGEELTEMYCDPSVDTMISCGGGELMCEILEYVDFDRIKAAPPKLFMGYSDNTNFTYTLATICDVASIYGPCANEFGMEPWHESIRQTFDVFTGKTDTVHSYQAFQPDDRKFEETLATINDCEPRIHRIAYQGEFIADARTWNGSFEMSGRLIGGCMDCLVNLLGTEFDHTEEFLDRYESEGCLWFIEACDLNVYAIRRAMWQMEHAGWFRTVKGFVFGRPLNGQEMFGLDAYRAVLEVAEKHHVPVIMDADLGHVDPAMPLIMGSYATARVSGNDLSIRMECR